MISDIEEMPPKPDHNDRNILKDLGIEPLPMTSGIEVTMENLIKLLVNSKDNDHA